MMSVEALALLAGIFLIAVLYSSVGHAGASGYIAVMSLLAMSPAAIKPTALSLNILVSLIATWQFFRAGHLSWTLLWPFAVLAVPAAFLGGYLDLPAAVFRIVVGVVLLYSASRFFAAPATEQPVTKPPLGVALASGAAIGFLAGLTGTGGGIFLTPLLLLMGWANARTAAAVSALFILFNSSAGLLGAASSTANLPAFTLPLLAAAGLGGALGSHLGGRRLAPGAIRRFLAAVLLIAGLKLIFA